MIKRNQVRSKPVAGRFSTSSEKGQAALAIILGIVLVMVTVPLVADLLVNGQQAVVYTTQNQQQAVEAAQAGLVDFENHIAADADHASPLSSQGYCSADGSTLGPTATTSFLNQEPIPGAAGSYYSGCDTTGGGDTDPNDPGFSNSFDPKCTTSVATNSLSQASSPFSSFGWDVYSGSVATGAENSEYQFIVDARAVTPVTISAGDAVAYVYVTGRSGVSLGTKSGQYICRSIKAAVNVLDPTAATSTATSAWGSPSINEPTPPPNATQTVTFSLTGASGAAGGGGIFVKGGSGGLGGTVSGSFTAPADFPLANGQPSGTPIFFGTEAGYAAVLGNKVSNCTATPTASSCGYAQGGVGGKDGGAGGGATAFCVMPEGALSAGTCTPSMPICPSAFNASSTLSSNLTQDSGTGCIIAIAAGGGGGGEGVFFLPAGSGGNGGATPGAGGNAFGETNGGGAAKATAGGLGGSGTFLFFKTQSGTNGGLTAVPATEGGPGGNGATYGLGGDGGGGGGGYYGGGGGGAGFLIIGGGGGGGGINWSQSWTNISGSAAVFNNGTAPAGTKNGSAYLAVTTESNDALTTTYTVGCTGTTPTPNQVASPPNISNATWNSVGVQLAGGGGGGGAVPPEKSTQPYGEPGGVGGYIGGTNVSATGTVTLVLNGTNGSPTPPVLSYETGCGGGGGTAGGGSSTVAAADNGVALSALAGTLKIASSTTFTATGRVSVVTASGTAVLAYGGIGAGTLTGVTVVSGTTSWTLATGNAVTQATAVGSGGGGYGSGGTGGLGKNAGSANNGSDAASGGGGGASELCLGSATSSTGCNGSTQTCTANPTAQSCVLAIAGGGGGGSEGTSDETSSAPPGPGGSGWGGLTNGSCTAGNYEPSGAYNSGSSNTWYWPGTSIVASGDNSKALSALGGTLDVGTSTSFTTTGQVYVVTSGGPATLAYTGTGTGTLTGVTVVSGTTTWTLSTGNAVTQVASPVNSGPPGSGTQGTTTGTGLTDKNGNGSSGSQAPCTGGAAGTGGTQTTAGNGGSSSSGCSSSGAGNAANGGSSESASCESGGGGGGGGYFGGGAGGGGTGGGYGGGGGSSYVDGYTTNGVAGNASPTPATEPSATLVTITTTTTPFVPPIENTTYVGPGAAGPGATSGSTTAGVSGGSGQAGVLILEWYYTALGQPEVTDSCPPTVSVFAQGQGSNPAYTYFPELGPTTFELSGGSGGNSFDGTTTPGAADVEYVTVDVQPGELFSYIEGCSGYLSLGGAGFAQGGSSGPTTKVQDLWTDGGNSFYSGGSDYGGEAGGGGGASALCAGAVCTPSEQLCPTTWNTSSSDCVLAIAGGGGGAGAATWLNTTTVACTAVNIAGGAGGGGLTPTSASTGTEVPGQSGWDPETTSSPLISSTVAAGDNGVALSALGGTLYVASSASFPALGGQVSVATSSGTAVLGFTGTASGTLTGVTLVSGTGSWTVATGNSVTDLVADGAYGGDSASTGTYAPPGVFVDGSAPGNDQGQSSSVSTTVSNVVLFGTAGGGGGYEGGEAGQSLSGTVSPYAQGCAGGGGSNWWLSGSVNVPMTGSMTNPLTGTPLSTTGSGTVTIQGFNTNVTAVRSSGVDSNSW